MDNRKAIYLDDAIDALESKKDKKAKGDIGGFYNKIIQNDIDALMQLPSADPEAAIVKVLKMVEEYKEKTGTDEIIIMPKNGMKAWDENGVEYTMQPTCNNLATDTISRASAIAEITEYGSGRTVYMSVGELKRRIEQLPSTQTEIIRCRDCKEYCAHDHRCRWWNHGTKESGWCCYAERREDGTHSTNTNQSTGRLD